MTVQEALRTKSVDRLDVEVLLAATLGINRAILHAHPEKVLNPFEQTLFIERITRRERHEPVAYILGETEFYGRKFFVSPATLIPRPATEVLIDATQEFLQTFAKGMREADTDIVITYDVCAAYETLWKHRQQLEIAAPRILDIGTGSGCIAITLALLGCSPDIVAVDTLPEALALAEKNAAHHGVLDRIHFELCDGIDAIRRQDRPFLIVSNPPYIPDTSALMEDVRAYEPPDALFGGEDGGDMVRAIIHAAKAHPQCLGYVLECMKHHVTV